MYNKFTIEIPKIELSEFCRKNYIRVLSIIDSPQHWNNISADHINMLVEFEPNRIPGLIRLGKIKIELTVLLGYSVDRTAVCVGLILTVIPRSRYTG